MVNDIDVDMLVDSTLKKVVNLRQRLDKLNSKPGSPRQIRRCMDALRQWVKYLPIESRGQEGKLLERARLMSRHNERVRNTWKSGDEREKRYFGTCVYLYRTKHGEYVGSTRDIYQRFGSHLRALGDGARKYSSKITGILIVRMVDSEEVGRHLERQLIRTFQPNLNVAGLFGGGDVLDDGSMLTKGVMDRPRRGNGVRSRPAQWIRNRVLYGMPDSCYKLEPTRAKDHEDVLIPFEDLYRRRQKIVGPLNIYAPHNYPLLVKWLGISRTKASRYLYWAHRRTWFAGYAALELAETGRIVAGKYRRRAKDKLRFLVDTQGCPTSSQITLTYRYVTERRALQAHRDAILKESSGTVRRWLKRAVKIQRVMVPRIKYLTRTAPACARKILPTTPKDIDLCAGVRVLKCPLSSPAPPGDEAKAHLRRQFLRMEKGCKKRVPRRSWEKDFAEERARYSSGEVLTEAEEHLREGGVICMVDKNKEVGLMLPAATYQAWCLQAAAADPNLKQVPKTRKQGLDSVNDEIKRWNEVEGREAKHTIEPLKELPYLYVLPKNKVLNYSAEGSVSFKPGLPTQKLFRKIISQVKSIRGKNRTRQRAAIKVMDRSVKKAFKTAEAFDLERAADEMAVKVARLRGGTCCKGCSCAITSPSGIVADATRFFELVGMPEIDRQSEKLKERCPSARNDIDFIMFCLKNLRYSTAGTIVLWQGEDQGTPIGGTLSKAACSCTLGGLEDANSLPPSDVATSRYVDDSANISLSFCTTCLALYVLGKLYFGVEFEVERSMEEGGGRMVWLDVSLEVQTARMKNGKKMIARLVPRPELKPIRLTNEIQDLAVDEEFVLSVSRPRWRCILRNIATREKIMKNSAKEFECSTSGQNANVAIEGMMNCFDEVRAYIVAGYGADKMSKILPKIDDPTINTTRAFAKIIQSLSSTSTNKSLTTPKNPTSIWTANKMPAPSDPSSGSSKDKDKIVTYEGLELAMARTKLEKFQDKQKKADEMAKQALYCDRLSAGISEGVANGTATNLKAVAELFGKSLGLNQNAAGPAAQQCPNNMVIQYPNNMMQPMYPNMVQHPNMVLQHPNMVFQHPNMLQQFQHPNMFQQFQHPNMYQQFQNPNMFQQYPHPMQIGPNAMAPGQPNMQMQQQIMQLQQQIQQMQQAGAGGGAVGGVVGGAVGGVVGGVAGLGGPIIGGGGGGGGGGGAAPPVGPALVGVPPPAGPVPAGGPVPYVPAGGAAFANVVPVDATAHAQDVAENIDKACLTARLVFLQGLGELTAADIAGVAIGAADHPAAGKLANVGNRARVQNLYGAFRRAGFITTQNRVNGLSASPVLVRAVALSHQVA